MVARRSLPISSTPFLERNRPGRVWLGDAPKDAIVTTGPDDVRMVEAAVNSHYQMYVLFQPAGAGTIPVPLGVFNWEWVTLAIPSADGQTIAVAATAQIEPGHQAFEQTTTVPTWPDVVTILPLHPPEDVIPPPQPHETGSERILLWQSTRRYRPAATSRPLKEIDDSGA